MIDSLQVHQSEEVPTRKIAAFSYFYDRAVDAGMLQQGESAVVQVREMEVFLGISRVSKRALFGWVWVLFPVAGSGSRGLSFKKI